MLTLPEKLQTAPALLPMLVEGQKFIDLQDELSVFNFMEKYGMPDRINTEVFIAMAKALDFIDPEKLSMTVVLTAMNRFLNETDGLQMAFIDGNQTERLCEPLKEYIEARGGQVLCEKPIKSSSSAYDPLRNLRILKDLKRSDVRHRPQRGWLGEVLPAPRW